MSEKGQKCRFDHAPITEVAFIRLPGWPPSGIAKDWLHYLRKKPIAIRDHTWGAELARVEPGASDPKCWRMFTTRRLRSAKVRSRRVKGRCRQPCTHSSEEMNFWVHCNSCGRVHKS